MAYKNNYKENNNKRGELVKIAALWTAEDQQGNFYLSGKFGDAKAFVLPNNFKKEKGSTQPDFFLYVQKYEGQKQQREDNEENNEGRPF